MTERTNKDVAVVREALELLPEMPDSELNPDGDEQARESKRLVAQEGRAALDRLQARLEAAEADRTHTPGLIDALRVAEAERDEARADAERLKAPWLCDCHTWPGPDEAHAYIVALEADAERLAEALRGLRDWIREGFGTEADAAEMCDAALAAHTPHLTGPKHKPIGTFYTTEDASSGAASGTPETAQGIAGASRSAQGVLDGNVQSPPAPDDIGPPAPGEGDHLENPEMEVEC